MNVSIDQHATYCIYRSRGEEWVDTGTYRELMHRRRNITPSRFMRWLENGRHDSALEPNAMSAYLVEA